MPWEIQYYSETVRQDIAAWPVGIRAMYARITERMQVFGPHLGMPFTRPLGEGLFEVRAKGKEGIGRAVVLHHFWPDYDDPSRLHQEDPEDTPARPATCPETTAGGTP